MKCGIYEICNTLNNHRYIGSSKNVEHRISDHRNKLKKGCAYIEERTGEIAREMVGTIDSNASGTVNFGS